VPVFSCGRSLYIDWRMVVVVGWKYRTPCKKGGGIVRAGEYARGRREMSHTRETDWFLIAYFAEPDPEDGDAESVSTISCSELSSLRRLSSVLLMPLSASTSRRPTPLQLSVMSSSSSMHSCAHTAALTALSYTYTYTHYGNSCASFQILSIGDNLMGSLDIPLDIFHSDIFPSRAITPPFLHSVGHSPFHHHHPPIYNIKRSTVVVYKNDSA